MKASHRLAPKVLALFAGKPELSPARLQGGPQ